MLSGQTADNQATGLFLTHGGSNSVMESILLKMPMGKSGRRQ